MSQQGVQRAYEQDIQPTTGQGILGSNQRILDAMNKWSAGFFKLTLPSGLGTKATIKEVADEGAKVLSMGTYLGQRTATVDAVPYDGSRYEGETLKDESQGTLWMYQTSLPEGFTPLAGESFLVSLGKHSSAVIVEVRGALDAKHATAECVGPHEAAIRSQSILAIAETASKTAGFVLDTEKCFRF